MEEKNISEVFNVLQDRDKHTIKMVLDQFERSHRTHQQSILNMLYEIILKANELHEQGRVDMRNQQGLEIAHELAKVIGNTTPLRYI